MTLTEIKQFLSLFYQKFQDPTLSGASVAYFPLKKTKADKSSKEDSCEYFMKNQIGFSLVTKAGTIQCTHEYKTGYFPKQKNLLFEILHIQNGT